MNAPSLERFERAWGSATARAPINEQRSLVRLLESLQAKRLPTTRARATGWLAAAAALVLTLGLGGYAYHRSEPTVSVVGGGAHSGAWVETPPAQQRSMHFSEGSQILIAESSRVRVGGESPRGAQVTVDHGGVRASIVHQKNTRWAVAAGPFNVRVTGTVLRVDWRPAEGEFHVAVDEGSVVAEGPLLGGGRVITQGGSCRVSVATSEIHCVSPTSSSSGAQGSAAAAEVHELPLVNDSDDQVEETATQSKAQGTKSGTRLLELERAGKYADALALADQLGLSKLLASGRPEELFCLSRLGRYQGNQKLARDALVKVRDRFGKTKEAAHAAFLLGRQSAPTEAARWFATYLSEQPGGAFAREASGRLVESHHGAGRFGEAQAAARQYLSSYPTGPHAKFAKSLLANP